MLDILVIAPHPDDAELGMGGAILKLKADGLRVGVLDLTSGESFLFLRLSPAQPLLHVLL